jgi:hypothetical protein
MMTVWAWVAIGMGAAIGVPLLVGLGIGRILGSIAADVSMLHDQEQWLSAPLTRALDSPEEARAQATIDLEHGSSRSRAPKR